MQTIFKNNFIKWIWIKKESIQHAIHDGCQSENVNMVTIYKVAAILVFPNIAVYFKLNFLSSYICQPICCLHLLSLILQPIK